MKEYIQADFLLVLGNLNKAISYCRSAIQEFTQIKQLDIMDWISLITLLINCLLKVNIGDQATYYAQNLIAYIGKAQREGLLPTYLAVMMVLGLESLYVTPKSELITKAKQFKLPQPFLDSLQHFLLSPKMDNNEAQTVDLAILNDVVDNFQARMSKDQDCSFLFKRKANHALILTTLQKLDSGNSGADFLVGKFSELFNSLSVPKKIAYTANLGIVQFLQNKKQEAFTNLKIVKDMLANPEAYGYASKSAKLKSTDILDQMNNFAVFEFLQGGGKIENFEISQNQQNQRKFEKKIEKILNFFSTAEK